jgi:hypothetical protein
MKASHYGRSCQWGITVLLVLLVNVNLWMSQFESNSKEIMLCGEQVEKLPIVHGADRHHAAEA